MQRLNSYISHNATQEYLKKVLSDKKDAFVSNLVSLVANNAKLQECEPATLMYGAIRATASDLPLDPAFGCAYLIPYKNNKLGITEAQFQIGYRAYGQLALRSGLFKCINDTDVREGELVNRNRLTGQIDFNFEQDDKRRSELPIIGYVSYFQLLNGFESTLYMSVEELKAHGLRYSQTYRSQYANVRDSSKWVTDFHEMCRKTVIKLHLSRKAPLSVEMQNAIRDDQAVFRSADTPEYVDTTGDEPLIDKDKASKVAAMFDDAKIVDENVGSKK
nr:MAG: RecT family protein [Bacteriophage sp.]